MKKEFGFVLAAAILLAGCGQKKETTTTTARPVKTTIVESRSIIRKDFSGIVEAVEYVKLAFRVNGQIIQLPVIEGQRHRVAICRHKIGIRNGFGTSGTQQTAPLPASDLRAGI